MNLKNRAQVACELFMGFPVVTRNVALPEPPGNVVGTEFVTSQQILFNHSLYLVPQIGAGLGSPTGGDGARRGCKAT